MATRCFHRILSVPRNFITKIDEGQKKDAEISQTLAGKATVLAAIEAKRSRTLFRDLVIHIIFFAVFIAILFMQRDVDSTFDINSGFANALITQQITVNLQPFPKTYQGVGQWSDYATYLQGVLIPAITTMQDYAGRNVTPDVAWTIQYTNKLVGAVRFRQMRVRNDSCHLSDQFTGVANICYSKYYDSSSKETRPFGPPSNPTKYTYTSDSGGVELYGHIRGFWDTSGYVVDIPLNDSFAPMVQELINDDFWGPATRAMLISMTTITPNYQDKATVLYLLTEFTAGGQVNPYSVARTFRIAMYIGDSTDNFRAFLEILFVLIVVYYSYELVRGFVVSVRVGRKKDYILNLWNIIELVNLGLFVTSIGMYLSYLGMNRTDVDLTQTTYIARLEVMGESAVQFYQLSAINILLSAIKTFKYLQMSPRLYVLWETLYHARVDLATYMIMFLIILLGFLLFGWLTFGPDLPEFDGFITSLGTLWQFLIGNPPDYSDLTLSNRVLGPIYYALFTVFVFFILVNMFVAIVSNSYGEVSSTMAKDDSFSTYDIRKPLKRLLKVAKAVYRRKPMYSETDLLRMLQNKELLEKDTLTKQEVEQELKNLGEDPLSLYIERLLSIHEKRKKLIVELQKEEIERQKEELEDEYDRRVEHGESVSALTFKLNEHALQNMDVVATSSDVLLPSNGNSNDTNLTHRMDLLEAKLDLVLRKLDDLLK